MSRLIRTVSSRLRPLCGLNTDFRHRPESMTILTFSMVRDVSAIGVARTTLRFSPGAMARRCASGGSIPYRGCISVSPNELPSSSAQRRMSASPGRNARMSPSCSLCARRMTCATASVAFSGVASTAASTISTGYILPSPATRGASSSRQMASVSMVADIITILRSGRMMFLVWRTSASARSQLRLRSWNSSKMTVDTPSSVGSSTSILVRMPSVRTSTLVASDTRDSKRTRYPAVRPTGSSSSQAMRSAICLAARRLGSSISTFPEPASCRMVRGSSVDFPAPGGAVTTTAPHSRRASFTLRAIAAAGNPPARSITLPGSI